MHMQNLGGQTQSIMEFSKVAYLGSLKNLQVLMYSEFNEKNRVNTY